MANSQYYYIYRSRNSSIIFLTLIPKGGKKKSVRKGNCIKQGFSQKSVKRCIVVKVVLTN